MPDREKVIRGLERCLICDMSVIAPEENQKAYMDCEYTIGLYCGRDRLLRDALAMLKQEAMNVDTFVQWCIDSHIMGDATVRGIKYWVEKFKEGR